MGIDKGSMVKLPDLNLDEESRKVTCLAKTV